MVKMAAKESLGHREDLKYVKIPTRRHTSVNCQLTLNVHLQISGNATQECCDPITEMQKQVN